MTKAIVKSLQQCPFENLIPPKNNFIPLAAAVIAVLTMCGTCHDEIYSSRQWEFEEHLKVKET